MLFLAQRPQSIRINFDRLSRACEHEVVATPEVFKEQQALADKFSEIGLLPVKVNVSSATWSLDKK